MRQLMIHSTVPTDIKTAITDVEIDEHEVVPRGHSDLGPTV